ncbi:HlyD family secretion protein [Chiayiivirga flava]|uniref:Multidrug resistance efflux pump n=1 Tax=Chiayiivirga flava TaxID=659595 RepID=A0A7W8D5J8_9GAMM|nr:HlyD family secretion protein [Chiayiivirga flava]MBB5207942.1 multidrug resistance efflux pump [Chiayiivirga flava]
MIRPTEMLRAALALALLPGAQAQAQSMSLSGEVRALGAEAIYVPPSNSSPVVLRYYVPQGERVEPGDVLVRIDPGQSLRQIRELDAQIEQARATAAKEAAELAVKQADAQIALVQAEAVRDKARVDAAIPASAVSALDFDRYRGELERAEREHALKTEELAAARAAVERRRADGALEIRKLETERDFHRLQVAASEQRATRAGMVVHGFDPWQGTRYDEGSSAQMGNQIGEVIGDGALGVRAWALEPERAWLAPGQAVTLLFDALPGTRAQGRIERIGGAPEPKAEWGSARWFTLDIAFIDDVSGAGLLPGMSVRVAVDAGVPGASTARSAP